MRHAYHPSDAGKDRYDLLIGETGFGSMFRFPRVLMVECGAYCDHAWQIENQRNSEFDPESPFRCTLPAAAGSRWQSRRVAIA
jgi:hypothetical protein